MDPSDLIHILDFGQEELANASRRSGHWFVRREVQAKEGMIQKISQDVKHNFTHHHQSAIGPIVKGAGVGLGAFLIADGVKRFLHGQPIIYNKIEREQTGLADADMADKLVGSAEALIGLALAVKCGRGHIL